MPNLGSESRRRATAIFKLGLKASRAGIHRTLNPAPRGAGWVQCVNSPAGVMCRPEKVRESIEHFERAYQEFSAARRKVPVSIVPGVGSHIDLTLAPAAIQATVSAVGRLNAN